MQFGRTYTREFFKDFKLHSSFGLVQFRSSLKNSLVHVFSKLHSKPYYYLYKLKLSNQKTAYVPRDSNIFYGTYPPLGGFGKIFLFVMIFPSGEYHHEGAIFFRVSLVPAILINSAVKVTHFLGLVTVTVTFPKKELVTGKSYLKKM